MQRQAAQPGQHLMAIFIGMALLGGSALVVAQPSSETASERFGAREPRTCADTRSPAGNEISADLAAQYFACNAESIQGNQLRLVENVKVEVGGGVPYTPNLGSFSSIDVSVPIVPIRGSYLAYQCRDLIREHSGPADTSCAVYEHAKATGYCYKTTFSDWSCYMADASVTGSAYQAPGPKS